MVLLVRESWETMYKYLISLLKSIFEKRRHQNSKCGVISQVPHKVLALLLLSTTNVAAKFVQLFVGQLVQLVTARGAATNHADGCR